MVKNKNRNIVILGVILLFVIIYQNGIGPFAVIPCQVTAGETVAITTEMKAKTGVTQLNILPEKLDWTIREGSSEGTIVKEGTEDVPATSAQQLKDLVDNPPPSGSRTVIFTSYFTAPEEEGYYDYRGAFRTLAGVLIPQIEIDYKISSCSGFPDNTFQVIAAEICPADYTSYDTIDITHGTLTITIYHDFANDYPTCTETTQETDYLVVCEGGYNPNENGRDSTCDCINTEWTPLPSTVCSGNTFTQTSNCGNTRESIGTKDCNGCTDTTWTPSKSNYCNNETFTQTSNCGNTKTVSGIKECGEPETKTDEWCEESDECSSKGLCEADDEGKKCISICAPWEKWDKKEGECGMNWEIIILVFVAIVAIKMFKGK